MKLTKKKQQVSLLLACVLSAVLVINTTTLSPLMRRDAALGNVPPTDGSFVALRAVELVSSSINLVCVVGLLVVCVAFCRHFLAVANEAFEAAEAVGEED